MRRFLITLFVAFASSTFLCDAQSVVWAKFDSVSYYLNYTYADFALTLDEPSSKIYDTRLSIGHQVYGQQIFGEQVLECRDLSGSLLWSYKLGLKAVANHVVTDPNGDIYLSGIFMDTLWLDNLDFLDNTGSGFNNDIFIIKLNNSGNLIWKRNLSKTWSNIPEISALDIDNNGDCWYAFSDFMTGKIIQLDASGNDNTIHQMDECKLIGNISFDMVDGLYVSGSTGNGVFTMDNDSFPVSQSYSMFVARFSPDGTKNWAKFAHDITFQRPVVVSGNDDYAYLCGNRFDTLSWGGITFSDPLLSADFFVTRVDSSGDFSWGLQQPPLAIGPFGLIETGKNVYAGVDANNNLYFGGTIRGVVDLGTMVVSSPSLSEYRSIILKVDPFGKPIWANIGGSSDVNYFHTLATAQNGECYFTGMFGDTAVFDTVLIQTQNIRNFVVGKIGNISTDVSEIPSSNNPPFYVDAAEAVVLDAEWVNCSLRIYDISGRLIYKNTNITSRYNHFEFIAPGIYVIQMAKNGLTTSGKFLKTNASLR